MRTLVAKILGIVMLFAFVALGTAFADENENVALKGQVKDLTKKVDSLTRQVEVLSATPKSSTTAYVTPSETGGGLIHTAQDIKMSGYADVQYNQNLSNETSNGVAGGAQGNPLRVFDGAQNSFTVNQFDLNLSKDANPEGGVGFMLDILAGEDIRVIDTATTGATANRFGFDQGYIDIVAPLKFLQGNDILDDTIDLKVGRMVTLAGAEVIRVPDNWNISRSFNFGLGIPFTHTGVRAQYNLFQDKVATYWGINNGWDNVIDNNMYKTMEFGLSVNPIEHVNWFNSIYFGPETARQSGHKRFLWSSVLGWDATDQLHLKAEFTWGNQRRVPGPLENTPAGSFNNAAWWGMAYYVRYDLTEKWGVNYRIEFFRDDTTFRTGLASGAPIAQSLWANTLTTDYKLYDNLTGRLEYRLDRSNVEPTFAGNASQSTIGAELIYAFA